MYENATLGIGISFTEDFRTGKIFSISSPLDIVSLNAFRKMKLFRSADNTATSTHWIPLYINKEHGERCMHLAPRYSCSLRQI